MAARTVESDTNSRIFSIRIPERLEQQLETIAQRDANSVSATVRRLISVGLRAERRGETER